MSNITPIKRDAPQPSVSEICDNVIRAKQIVRAVRVASEHDDSVQYEYALEQVEDMLAEARDALSLVEDAEGRRARNAEQTNEENPS